MNHQIDSPEVGSYLSALEARMANLPADQSEEILFGVREHIAEALERGGQSTTEVLISLGSPDDIIAGLTDPGLTGTGMQHINVQQPPTQQTLVQQPRLQQPGRPNYQSSTLWVVATAILLPFGIFLAGVGYLFGLAGLWMGTRWKLWEKIMGTLLFPGGMLGAFYATVLPNRLPPALSETDSAQGIAQDPFIPGMGLAAGLAMMCIPIIVAVYLLVSGLRRHPDTVR